ncbi:SDR family oxidoreductase [Candidatus Micrarchaeota archaeon]|nr:SDR family oxidoreductase [Candidatus Micrarchaeota archaeon]
MQRALVTGGSGFIGSFLCLRLLEEGYGVICMDSLITGRKKNIEHLVQNKDFEFIESDITKPPKPQQKNIDLIFNLASPASPKDYLEYPLETLMANSIGVRNMLEIARANNAVFVQASTSEVYGDPLVSPQKEDYWGNVNPAGTRSCYDEGKRFAEALCFEYFNHKKTKVRVARIFNTYGPRMRENDGRVIPNFITQALLGRPITVYGKGDQTRSFCYVSDMVEGLLKLGAKDGLDGQTINLGNPNPRKIMEVAQMIREMCNSKSEIVGKDLPLDDPKTRQPDIGKAKSLLGFSPKVGMELGLAKTIEYFKNLKKLQA